MKIAFISGGLIRPLASRLHFDGELPLERWGFPLSGELVCGFVNAGHEVVAITPCGATQKVVRFEAKQSAGTCVLFVGPEPKIKWQFLTLYRKEVQWMRNLLRDVRPDVVIANWTYQYAYASLTSGIPTLVVAHDSSWRIAAIEKSIYAIFRAVYAQMFVYPRIRHLSTVSPYMVTELRRFNRYKGDIVVVPNGVETCLGVKRPIREAAKTIVCVSQWGTRKNIKSLLKAFAIISLRHQDWRLILIGHGMGAGQNAEKWCQSANVKHDAVEFSGCCGKAEIEVVLREKADIFCTPSLEESFGMTLIEAMACGVVCVGGRHSGAVPWILGNGETGVLSDVESPEILAKDLERVMLDSSLRRRLSQAGLKRVREWFLIDKVIQKYVSVLKGVVACESLN